MTIIEGLLIFIAGLLLGYKLGRNGGGRAA